VDTALDDIPAIDLTLEEAVSMKQGREFKATNAHLQSLDRFGFDRSVGLVQGRWQQRLLGICDMQDGWISPRRLFNLIDPLGTEGAREYLLKTKGEPDVDHC